MTRRLQLRLDEQRYERVADAARRQRTSVAAVVRDAIDRGLAPDDRRSAAARRILTAPPMDAPDVDQLVEEMRHVTDRHG